MHLKRDIYKNLLDWKKRNEGKVLELEGSRQVGKTYILNEFAKEYRATTYINMIASSGEEFLRCWHTAKKWEPGEKRIEKPMHKALALFDPEFTDSNDHLVVIDEIQESAELFSRIREFAREFEAHFVVTGSYLGKTLEKEYFFSAGDIEKLKMETLTFSEFLDALGKRDVYDNCSLYGESDHNIYNELRDYFEIYLKIGGYPEVILHYLKTKDVNACRGKIESIIDTFTTESTKYFETSLEKNIFNKLFSSIAVTLLKEKKGTDDLLTDLSKIVFKEESGRVTKKMINAAISWLSLSHQITYCSKSINCDYLNIVDNARYYFTDLGVAYLFLRRTGEKAEVIEGILCENFVCQELIRRIRKGEIAGSVPWFGIEQSTGGELDFYVRSLLDYNNYGIEVKRGSEPTKTANALLKQKKLDILYVLKKTYGGIVENRYTVPIYLVEKITFDLDLKK